MFHSFLFIFTQHLTQTLLFETSLSSFEFLMISDVLVCLSELKKLLRIVFNHFSFISPQPSLIKAIFNGKADQVRSLIFKKEDVNVQVNVHYLQKHMNYPFEVLRKWSFFTFLLHLAGF